MGHALELTEDEYTRLEAYARQAAAAKGSAKYCVSNTTWAARNAMMLTVS